jgi:hypothetical protein
MTHIRTRLRDRSMKFTRSKSDAPDVGKFQNRQMARPNLGELAWTLAREMFDCALRGVRQSMARERWSICIGAACVAIIASLPCAVSQTRTQPGTGRVVEWVKPSETDPAIQRFDDANYILFDANTPPHADLLLFMTGTGGRPPGAAEFLNEAVDAGYRVISLAYNDTPAINVYCPARPDLACAEKFRQMRIYGEGIQIDGAIDNTRAESIVNRLVKLLQYLDRREPERKWNSYVRDGALNWGRIAVAGQSQGAGMAAFIAKQQLVARVVLFSSPWDYVVSQNSFRRLAAWLSKPSKTPPERWFGGYHEREHMADLIASAYATLQVPEAHIRIFRLNLPLSQAQKNIGDAFHGEGISNPAYAEQRVFFLGHSP